MTDLSLAQRCRVASEIEQREFVALRLGPNGGGIPYVVLKSDPHNVLWKPEKNPRQWQLMVEWLAKQGDSPRHEGDDPLTDGQIEFESEFVAAIRSRDPARLEQLCFELLQGVGG